MIHILDLNFQNVPNTIASYLIIGPDGPVLVETGPGSTTETLVSKLSEHGYRPSDIKHILVTHIHFDHAGSAGWWALQGAQVYVHHFGARHLIAPEKLIASATRIYGDKMDTLWGAILPAPAEKITELHDGDTVDVAGLSFQVIETPGHARHHHVFRLGNIAFTGDALGIALPNATMKDLPAPPPEFDKEAWHETLNHLESERFETVYPTHFGPVDDVQGQIDGIRQLLDESAEFVKERMDKGLERDDLVDTYIAWNQDRARSAGLNEAQIHQYHTANPLDMSVDGIIRYWKKKVG